MSIRDWVFGRKNVKLASAREKGAQPVASNETPKPDQEQTRKDPSSLLEYLDRSNGTDDLYEILRTRSVAELEELCNTYPIESLRIDWPSVQSDFRNNQRFELITFLAQILVRYDEILKISPERRLPSALPAKSLAEILMARLMPFIGSQQHGEVAHSLRIRLYDFAMALIQAGRDRDALACLLASRHSIKDDHEFWICACRFNIALTSKNPEDVETATEHAKQIVSGRIRVSDQYVQGAKQMLLCLNG